MAFLVVILFATWMQVCSNAQQTSLYYELLFMYEEYLCLKKIQYIKKYEALRILGM